MKNSILRFKNFAFMFIGCAIYNTMYAQGGGGAGIQAAATEIKGYVTPITTLMYAIGLVVGIIGGIRIYIKWSAGDDINKELMGYGGAFIFLMVVPTVVKGFFG